MKKNTAKIGLSLLLLLSVWAANAQDQASWSISLEPKTPKVGDNAKLIFEANIKNGWHIYGTEDGCNGMGPILTSVHLESTQGFTATGKLKAIGFVRHTDEAFACEVSEKSGKAHFELPIKITTENITAKGLIDYMACDKMCVPLDYAFSKTFTALKSTPKTERISDNTTNTSSTQAIQKINADTFSSILNPTKDDSSDTTNGVSTHLELNNKDLTCDLPRRAGWDDISINRFKGTQPIEQNWTEIMWFILGAFLAGLITVFTPCVFPMLPMTVTFFTKKNKTKSAAIKQASIYGLSIVAIYTAFGVIAGKTMGEEFVNELSVNWVVNLIFFLIFVIFALSFMGMFEITLPNSLVNKVDAQSDRGGLIGTFFMALALVLVSFSCTGPIVSSIIILSAKGQWIVPTLTMLSFSIAFALPFTISAMFPNILAKLPKSGGWLNSIKVVLGLLELALSLKFLSQIDQVKNLGILDREVFLVIWIAIFLVISAYLFGKIRFAHDSPTDKISVPRGVLAIASLSFALYLLPGMWGAPLKSFAGILPPLHTQDFVLGNESKEEYLCDKPLYENDLHIAHNIKGYFDLRQAICCAKSQHKPLFIDFTGKGCSNCRLMEQKVWSDPRVLKMLKEDFVVASLYCDYNEIVLPENEQYANKSGKKIKTLGKSLQDFELDKFGTIGLPTYAIVGYDYQQSTKEKIVLNELELTHTFNTKVEQYLEFLQKAKENYAKLKD